MKILVTGSAGFICSAVIRYIINNTSDSVVNVDKLTYACNFESLMKVDSSERYAFKQVAQTAKAFPKNSYGRYLTNLNRS